MFLNNVLDLILFIIVSKKNTKEIYPITAPIAVPESISVKFSEVRAIKNPQPIINKINNIISATRKYPAQRTKVCRVGLEYPYVVFYIEDLFYAVPQTLEDLPKACKH